MPKIIINNRIYFLNCNRHFGKTFQTMTASECYLIKLLSHILFEKHIYFRTGKGQPMEPALCQLYRYTFIRYVQAARNMQVLSVAQAEASEVILTMSPS